MLPSRLLRPDRARTSGCFSWPRRSDAVSTDTASSTSTTDDALTAVSGRRMTRSVLLLSAITMVGSAVNYGSNLAFARVMTPASYGDLTSLLALSMVVAVPFTAAQTRVATRVAAHIGQGDGTVQYTVRHALAQLGVIALVATLSTAAIPLVKRCFTSRRSAPPWPWPRSIFASFLFPALQGALQGIERWVAFGLVGLDVDSRRVAFGLPWALRAVAARRRDRRSGDRDVRSARGFVWLLRDQVRRADRAARAGGVRGPRWPAWPRCGLCVLRRDRQLRRRTGQDLP